MYSSNNTTMYTYMYMYMYIMPNSSSGPQTKQLFSFDIIKSFCYHQVIFVMHYFMLCSFSLPNVTTCMCKGSPFLPVKSRILFHTFSFTQNKSEASSQVGSLNLVFFSISLPMGSYTVSGNKSIFTNHSN